MLAGPIITGLKWHARSPILARELGACSASAPNCFGPQPVFIPNLGAVSAQAEVYKWIEADGETQLGGAPPKNDSAKGKRPVVEYAWIVFPMIDGRTPLKAVELCKK